MKTVKKWTDAMSAPETVESLVLDVKQLPRVRFPAAKPMPKEIGQLVNLQSLRIRARNLEGLCDELATLPNLEHLEIDNTEFTEFEFGDVLGRLPALLSLDLYNMGLKGPIALPHTLQSLTLQDELELELDQWIESLLTLPELRSLSLMEIGLTDVPHALIGMSALRSLNLSSNALTTLPREFEQLSSLETLRLGNNDFTSVPDALRAMPQLKALFLDHNPLTEVPYWIGELTQLTQLGLSVTALSDLPPSLLSLPLEHLWIDVPSDVETHIRNQLPKCKIVSKNAEDVEQEVQRWLRFMGKL